MANTMNRTKGGKQSRDMMESAYNQIREMIFLHRIFPGQKLTYRELSKELGMSLTPVQVALGRLAQEGFVERISNVGYYVKKINLKEIEDLYDIRKVIEVYAVELTVKKQTPGNIRVLKKCYLAHKNYLAQIYDMKKLILDADFHSQIAAISGNHAAVRLLERIFEHSRMYSPVELIPPGRLNVAASEHKQIMQLIEERDVSGAMACMATHVQRAKEARIEMLAALPS